MPLVTPISADYIYQSDKVRCVPPQLVERSETILVGISFFISDDTKITDLSKEWARFTNEINTVKNKTAPERYYQVQYWSENQEIGGLFFFTGVEVSQATDINPLFVVKTIPKGKYLHFIHKGLSNNVSYTYKYIYTQFLPDTDYKLNKPFNFEFYGERYKGPCNEQSESDIFIPVE
jgi:AraC family transcriptional regulator